MAKSKVKKSLRPRRIFSEQLKKKIIKDIDEGKTNVTGAGREYQVSNVAIYRWLKKYSAHLHPSTTIVMQMESEQYRSRELEKKIAELESVIGRKQMEIDYLNKLIEVVGKDLSIDLKKNINTVASVGLGNTKTKKDSG